jgi:protein-S-isoprenylcysteine O-methyltransferase Ste14
MKNKKPLPPKYFTSSTIFIVIIHFILPVIKFVSFPWNLTGLIPIVIGSLLNLNADGSFKKMNTTVKPFEESTALLTDGVFRFSRNPMYLGMVLILSGISIVLGSLSPFFIILIFMFAMDFVFVRKEEAMLQNKFGTRWLEYKKTVRRWL